MTYWPTYQFLNYGWRTTKTTTISRGMWDNVWGFVGLDCLWHPFLSFIKVSCCCSFLAVLYFHYSDQLNWDRLQMERGVSPAGLLTSQLLEMLDRLSTLRPSYLCFCVSSSSLFARVHPSCLDLVQPATSFVPPHRPHGGLSSNASKTSSFNFCERVFMFLPSRPSQVLGLGELVWLNLLMSREQMWYQSPRSISNVNLARNFFPFPKGSCSWSSSAAWEERLCWWRSLRRKSGRSLVSKHQERR